MLHKRQKKMKRRHVGNPVPVLGKHNVPCVLREVGVGRQVPELCWVTLALVERVADIQKVLFDVVPGQRVRRVAWNMQDLNPERRGCDGMAEEREVVGPVRYGVFRCPYVHGTAQRRGREVVSDEALAVTGRHEAGVGSYEARDAQNVVIVAVGADDHVGLGHGKGVVPWIEGAVAVAGQRHLLEIRAQ